MFKARLSSRLHALRSRLWLAPSIASILALAASQLAVLADVRLGTEVSWFGFEATPDGSRELLATIATAMLTFTGLVFSITIVVLQLASGQFSPRVLRTFLEDRHAHMAMATFVGTFVYAMAVLPSIHGANGDIELFVPNVSVLVAFVLVLASVGVFIHYIDRMAHSVRAVTIIKRVARETRGSIEDKYEVGMSQAGADAWQPDEEPIEVISNDRPGIVAAVDDGALRTTAQECDACIEVVPMLGDFVPRGASVLRCWHAGGPLGEHLLGAVAIEDERTAHQDPMFGFRQLVDIAERALSPGINDPSTATQVLDELHDLLRMLAVRHAPASVQRDDAGVPRVILRWPDWDDFVRLACEEIRHYGARSIQVRRRLQMMIDDLLQAAPPERRDILEQQRALLESASAAPLGVT